MQCACSPSCALAIAIDKREKAEAQAAKMERAADKVKREKLKPRGHWVKLTQDAWNKARRLECLAAGDGCISCGRTQDQVKAQDGWKPGGVWDCGHFKSVGAYPNLRFERDNAQLQCKTCNGGSAHYAKKAKTVDAAYKANMIEKLGVERVDELEADQAPRHYTKDELDEIRQQARKKARELERQFASEATPC
jgi:hypothetical protein